LMHLQVLGDDSPSVIAASPRREHGPNARRQRHALVAGTAPSVAAAMHPCCSSTLPEEGKPHFSRRSCGRAGKPDSSPNLSPRRGFLAQPCGSAQRAIPPSAAEC
jgi:hypothetical protein